MKKRMQMIISLFMAVTATMSVSCQADKALTNEDLGYQRVDRGCTKQSAEEEGYYVVRAEGTGKTADLSHRAALYNAKHQLMAKLPQTVYGQTDYTETATTSQTGNTTVRSSATTRATGFTQYIDAYQRIVCENTYLNKNGGYLTVMVIKIPMDEVTILSVDDRNVNINQ